MSVPAAQLCQASKKLSKRGSEALLTVGQMSRTWRSMWNGTRHEPPSPVPMVAVRWLTRTTTPVMVRPSRPSKVAVVALLELSRLCRRDHWLRRRHVGRLLVLPLGIGVALHRQTGDLPGSFSCPAQARVAWVSLKAMILPLRI